jgi:hypothetical protein
MTWHRIAWVCLLVAGLARVTAAADLQVVAPLAKPEPVTMAELARLRIDGVVVHEVSDYVFGNYQGDFPAPTHADLNPRRAFVILWKGLPYRFVFSHEASYCPWFEFPSGAAVCFQFFEGNDGWAELFNQWGRQERNRFVAPSTASWAWPKRIGRAFAALLASGLKEVRRVSVDWRVLAVCRRYGSWSHSRSDSSC